MLEGLKQRREQALQRKKQRSEVERASTERRQELHKSVDVMHAIMSDARYERYISLIKQARENFLVQLIHFGTAGDPKREEHEHLGDAELLLAQGELRGQIKALDAVIGTPNYFFELLKQVEAADTSSQNGD